MSTQRTYGLSFIVLTLFLIGCFFLNVSLGSVHIPLKATFSSFFGGTISNPSWEYIVLNYRLPKALTAIISGAALSLSGLLMQTFFRNPLAGPFVLGISSGASLGAALLIMGSAFLGGFFSTGLLTDVSLAVAASLGSFMVLMAVVAVAHKVKDTMALLIIGLMFGSITGAIVSVLSYFTQAEKLQQFVYWSFGSVGNLSWNQVGLLFVIFLIGTVLGILCIKPLNTFLLGENYAQSLGIPLKNHASSSF